MAQSSWPSGSASSSSKPNFEIITQLGQSPADHSLLPPGQASNSDLWCGWTVQTSKDGKLFYHHTASGTSQWQMPRELQPILGEWIQAEQDGKKYWRNELLGVSSWKDPRKTSSLFQAALDGNLFFLQLYAEVGGFLDAVDGKGRTALHYNSAGGSTQAVLFLLQRNARCDVPDRQGSTPLHWACRYGQAPIVRLLLEAKCNPNLQNSIGDTAMHEAAALGQVDPLHWLVAAKADPLLTNRESKTPFEVAVSNKALDAAELLRKHESGDALPERSSLAGVQNNDAGLLDEFRKVSYEDSDSDGDPDDKEPNLALLVVRAARPLLRGVQWLANRLLGEKKSYLGESSKPHFDNTSRQWVLDRDDAAESSGEESVEEDSGDEGGLVSPSFSLSRKPFKPASFPTPTRCTASETEGMA